MIINEAHVDLETPTGTMRTHTYEPAAPGSYPGVVLFSEIYQVTGPIQRVARWLAGHGYIVAAPEIYHELEELGSQFGYDDAGTEKGNAYKIQKAVSAYDSDARAVLDYLKGRPDCNGRLGSIGICIGGHLSLRCSFNPDVLAAVCFYATDVHKGSLGKGGDDSLARFGEIKGETMMIWGRQDRHVPVEGRQKIYNGFVEAGVNFTWHEFNARHAFIRDAGYRYNPTLQTICLEMVAEMFCRKLQLGEPTRTPGDNRPDPC